MDPNVCLDSAANEINHEEDGEAEAYLSGYANWRLHGGFQPIGGDTTWVSLCLRFRAKFERWPTLD